MNTDLAVLAESLKLVTILQQTASKYEDQGRKDQYCAYYRIILNNIEQEEECWKGKATEDKRT